MPVTFVPTRMEALEVRTLLAATPLLPDLKPWADQPRGYLNDWAIDKTTIPGRTLLRLTSATANIGKGVMEIHGGAPGTMTTQPVYQRIYNSEGTFEDRLCGTFIYHPTHHHIHFEDFNQYDLHVRNADGSTGKRLAGGSKTSFCLEDVDVYDKNLPGVPTDAVFVECTDVVQGVSVGWADVYDKLLDGQTIDITGVPSGKYWLSVTADPLNRLVESNETNNTTRIGIDLHVSDDTRGSAFDVGKLTSSVSYDEFVGIDDRNDYYKFSLGGKTPVSIKIDQINDDADLRLYDASGNQIGSSLKGGTQIDSITKTLAAGTYYVRVFDVAGGETYHLSIAPSVSTQTSTLIKAGDTWKYLDNGSNLGTAWRDVNFSDSSWKSGKAQLGYGEGDEATTVKFGPSSSNKYITTYFRKSFTIASASQITALSARMIRDDGAVVYLNGKEVWRSNMPSGTIGHTTRASDAVMGSDESKWFTATLDKSKLVSGKNEIAIELHQSAANSVDLSFDFELKATTSITVAARPLAASPVAALFGSHSKITADSDVLV